ncbi:MAG: hypothetical protein JWN27_2524 [Candidatus Eremiobacteraeota bacterium]|nr:hypothetical protein [Candidatus Eremiobacteraeota bacterium]
MLTCVVFVATAEGCSHTGGRSAEPAVTMQRAEARVAYRAAADVRDIVPGRGAGVIFVDAMKQAAPWYSRNPLVLDRAGNVRFLAPGQVAETVLYPRAAYPAGDYTLMYAGKGRFDFNGTGAAVIARSRGRIVLRIVPRPAGIRMRVTATDPSDPLRDVRLVLPGFAQTYASSPFHPLFLQALRSFNVLRFKDWMHGDTFVETAVWPGRPATTRATQVAPAGVAPEYMVALANATGKDPWFTLPVGATDMYIYQFAALVHQTLDPRLHATFEYGHEAWKPGTPSYAYAVMAGQNLQLAADRNAAAVRWYARRSTQMFALVQRAFGVDARRAHEAVKGAVAAASTRPLSRDALERWHAPALAQARYMPLPPPPPPTAAPAPPIPLAAECRSPQCRRSPQVGRSGSVSPGLSALRRRQTTHDAYDSLPDDYRT